MSPSKSDVLMSFQLPVKYGNYGFIAHNYLAGKELSSNQTLTADEVFKRAYTGDHRLVLQTCISKDGNNEWGRMFIIAKSESTLEKLPPFCRTSL